MSFDLEGFERNTHLMREFQEGRLERNHDLLAYGSKIRKEMR